MVKKTEKKEKNAEHTRPPIVVIMGHVDHGKTKTLDYIRKTKVMESESGGITQHIGAYEAEHNGKKITFIDTPGHEAFTAMRSRGARVADIAVLVVAADEGVKPQTKESIQIIKKTNIPFVVALNKMDKGGADANRVKKELAESEVLVEGWGGQVPVVEISAKEGKNIDELLETILLLAELQELKSDPAKNAEGVVIESHRDARRGVTTTLLLREGSLRKGEFLALGGFVEGVRILENFTGKPIEEARASMPVVISSLDHIPVVGDTFMSFKTRSEAEAHAKMQESKELSPKRAETAVVEEKPMLALVLKSDVSGSQEALDAILASLVYPEVGVKILKSELGDIGESDIKTAIVGHALVAGFRVKVVPATKQLAEANNINIIVKDVIYDLVDAIKAEMSDLITPTINRVELGKAKILATFKSSGSKQIVGGRVLEGKLKNGAKLEIVRQSVPSGEAKILQLQQNKKNVETVAAGFEFGIMAAGDGKIQEGDTIMVFDEEIIRKRL
ncbi:MAG: translation initiation factor IF-2 [Candidatus Sungbacteria bacterium RIFCSPLOWO2_02_FULL_47_9]|uniref:Translation initiation factor IF-2 n=1 Tax=Candidatus Sungbacteria bacterium RIFCSPHIGHO2_01_FULL_47_32 TaxID=1802264 RepID=A0A1G2K509_9BACT|nr:MAG: Translation initiation factor IF-2 [Parcubacteria group bacterium GW2011_GWA2_47_10]OGZ94502.1 MAG: translation initiation factor IF-2 [Candidatus Sungbacteria bacterium RIFCSPHIGHO2_01_FULL_47_32]OGZ98936.1 MAG: translation initiation factor IF-2 [Candidatus Sungbacteria bacterium RIFCSPHIGHO2_02_FULL_46_12]OHA05094.1 MAG: translation initiation factor IF-2 [Candidatus Sungbacteria bacterium RIFCSPLOWO2_01_FULL_47_32]OHA09523.1 MAG: translation initiation factor IF-2 [Candidatus Sungba